MRKKLLWRLECCPIDFNLRRFRFFLVGGPQVKIITDHKPLVSVFAHTRSGSTRCEKIKLRSQDIDYMWLHTRKAKEIWGTTSASNRFLSTTYAYTVWICLDGKLLFTLNTSSTPSQFRLFLSQWRLIRMTHSDAWNWPSTWGFVLPMT